MPPAYIVLAGFTLWSLMWLLVLVGVRIVEMRKGNIISSFNPPYDKVPPFGRRVARVYGNCLETLPIYASLVLVAGATSLLHILGDTVWIFLGARIAQSLTHAYSTQDMWSYIRGIFFAVQVFLMLYWGIVLLLHGQHINLIVPH